MGESDRYQEYRVKKQRFTLGQDGNALMWLVTLNAFFLILLLTLQAAYFFDDRTLYDFQTELIPWFHVPANATKFSERPWTLFSFMFSDVAVIRIISNMIWLWAFGSILQGIAGNRKLIPIYLYGGFVGAIFFLLSNTFIPSLRAHAGDSGLLGANAAVIAVATATCMVTPNYKFFPMLGGGISIWILLAIYLIIDYAGVSTESAAYSLSHLGGALAGFFFEILLKTGWDGSAWMNRFFDWFMNLFDPYKKNRSTSAKDKIFYNTGNRSPYSKTSNITQQRIDEILDKINQKGYNFLTDDEKNILKRAADE
ncbi:MAG TPA: rhomboid family intramembrane serine protease [Ferruginibacter sp.]|nr:rhomboid family intramembrane serine protease [Ferruginibacter sp.]